MSWHIEEDREPKRCCARCGNTPAQVRRMGWDCQAYGVVYKRHIWIWWEPA